MMDFDYPSGKNQRFLPPPLTMGGFWCGAYRSAKLQFEVAEPNRVVVRRKLPAIQARGCLPGGAPRSESKLI